MCITAYVLQSRLEFRSSVLTLTQTIGLRAVLPMQWNQLANPKYAFPVQPISYNPKQAADRVQMLFRLLHDPKTHDVIRRSRKDLQLFSNVEGVGDQTV